jgi:hypothetical protein
MSCFRQSSQSISSIYKPYLVSHTNEPWLGRNQTYPHDIAEILKVGIKHQINRNQTTKIDI